MPLLCIIDAQTSFIANNSPIIDVIVENIKLFKKLRRPIAVLEYNDCGNTVEPIMKAIGKYKRAIKISKKRMDGGLEVIAETKKQGVPIKDISVCGAYTRACVWTTAETLARSGSKIKVVPNGVAESFHGNSEFEGKWADDLQKWLDKAYENRKR